MKLNTLKYEDFINIAKIILEYYCIRSKQYSDTMEMYFENDEIFDGYDYVIPQIITTINDFCYFDRGDKFFIYL